MRKELEALKKALIGDRFIQNFHASVGKIEINITDNKRALDVNFCECLIFDHFESSKVFLTGIKNNISYYDYSVMLKNNLSDYEMIEFNDLTTF